MNPTILQNIADAQRINTAILNFQNTNPDLSSYSAPDPNLNYLFPDWIIMGGIAVPISYNKTANVITIRSL